MFKKEQGVFLDFMNRNTIVSLAMLYALWQSKQQDLLDLIRPFVLFSVGNTTNVGQPIDVLQVREYLEKEFGYKSFQTAVIHKVLNRECANPSSESRIVRKKGEYRLVRSYSELIDMFAEKRTNCKAHSDAVTSALATYLNANNVRNRGNYSQQEAEVILLSFFERRGSEILLSVDDLTQILARKDEIDYFVGKFILAEHDKKSVLMDYLVELVKGYFVTTALYLQAENNDVTRASFSDVTFFLDTRILLGYLGYKSEQENNSVQEMIKSLQKNGAKLSCFTYNEDEISSILEAYRMSTILGSKGASYTLEYFDNHGRSAALVEAAQRLFSNRLKDNGITSKSFNEFLHDMNVEGGTAGILDDEAIKNKVTEIKPQYKFSGFSDDMSAINTVSRIRKGKKLPYIEKCKAVFVTSNNVLVAAVRQYQKINSIDYGFPLAITGDDLCVLAWLKDFESDNNLPQMRLLENVLAAITPSRDLMEAYFSNLDNLRQQGRINDDEVALLRVDLFAKKELMELTYGDKNNVTGDVIEEIRNRIRGDSFDNGMQHGREAVEKEYSRKIQDQRNAVCKRAEREMDEEYAQKERNVVNVIKITSVVAAIAFIVASVVSLCYQWGSPINLALLVVAVVTTVEGVLPFLAKDTLVIKWAKNYLKKMKMIDIDKRKEQYLSVLDDI